MSLSSSPRDYDPGPRAPAPRRDVSGSRKGLYLLGNVLSGVGLVLFLSLFATVACQLSDGAGRLPDPRLSNTFGTGFARAIFGMFLIVGGRLVSGLAARGLAGSGAILDPRQARKDLEPFSRQAGGMVQDALDETVVVDGLRSSSSGDGDFETTLRKLHQLHADGILSDAEYAREKQDVLDRI